MVGSGQISSPLLVLYTPLCGLQEVWTCAVPSGLGQPALLNKTVRGHLWLFSMCDL